MMIALMLAACSAGPPADLDMTDPAAWLLAHLDDDPDEVAARIERLGEFARTTVPGSPPLDRAFQPQIPTEEQLADLPHEAGGAALYGVALAARSDQELEDHRALIPEADRACLEGDIATSWTRVVDGQGGCFGASACDRATAADTVEQVWGPASFTQRLSWAWREVELIDGREAYAGRAWQSEAALPGRASDALTQAYALEVVLPDPDDSGLTWQIHARWVSVTFGAPSPLDQAALGDLLVTDLDQGFLRRDAWLAGAPDCGL